MPMTRRQIFRLIAYLLLGIFLILLLVLYLLYFSAQRLPDFYRKTLAVDWETQEQRNKKMREKITALNNDLQKTGTPWQANFTADDLNAYVAVEQAKEGSHLFPKEIVEPRFAFSDRQADFACRVEQGTLSGILHLSLGLTLPEPNRFVIQVKSAKLGKLPISKEIPAKIIVETFEKESYPVEYGVKDGDPTITVTIDIKYKNNRLVLLDGVVLQNETIQLSGSTELVTDGK
jgi:hypothetical protein